MQFCFIMVVGVFVVVFVFGDIYFMVICIFIDSDVLVELLQYDLQVVFVCVCDVVQVGQVEV